MKIELKQVTIPAKLFNELNSYLNSRPFGEVADLAFGLRVSLEQEHNLALEAQTVKSNLDEKK